MIDLSSEELIPLREVPRVLPPRPTGKRVHISACYRWTSRGLQGVRLETLKVGGTRYTSIEALQRFAERTSSAEPLATQANHPGTRTRQKQMALAERKVEEILRRCGS